MIEIFLEETDKAEESQRQVKKLIISCLKFNLLFLFQVFVRLISVVVFTIDLHLRSRVDVGPEKEKGNRG